MLNDLDSLKNSGILVYDNLISDKDILKYFSMVKNFDYSIKHKSVASARPNENLFVKYLNLESIQKTKLYSTVTEIMSNLNYKVNLVNSYVHNYGVDAPTAIHIDNTTPTVIYYANPVWEIDWGGETFMLDEKDDIKHAVFSKPGRIIVFDGNTRHMGKPTSIKAKERRYIIVFKFIFVDENNNPQHQIPFLDQ
jgi:hypothetical protein